MSSAALERGVVGVLVGLAGFSLVACLAFANHAAVAPWWLPLACGLGVLVAGRAEPWPTTKASYRVLPPLVAGVLVLALVAVAYGALTTPSRHWDGAVAWDTTARFLADGLSLEQPYFRDPAVLAYSRDYPLLQPLLLATLAQPFGLQAGRVLFPLLYGLLGLLVWVTVRRRCTDADLPWLSTAAVLLVPTLASPGGGGIDSGYGDAMLLLATTAMTVGLWHRHVWLLAAGAVLAVMCKPEGLVYAGAATAVAFVVGDRRLSVAAAVGWLGAAALWLPVQRELVAPGAPAFGLAFAAAAAIGIVGIVLAATVAQRLGCGWRGRLALLGVAACAIGVAFVVVAPGLPAHGAMHAYFEAPGRLLQRLDLLPAYALGVLNHAFLRGGCGLACWCLLFALPLVWRQRGEVLLPAVFVVVGLGIVPIPFLLGPEADVAHYLRSSIARLLLHWTGPALLVATAALARTSAETETNREGAAEPQRGDA